MTSAVSPRRRARIRVLSATAAILVGTLGSGCAPAAPRGIAELSGSDRTTSTPSPVSSPTPAVTHELVVVTEAVPFERITQDDPGRDVGSSAIIQSGTAGTRTITYTVSYVDGVESERVVTADEITIAPAPEITAVGTRQPAPAPAAPSGCDPNYSGACVPIASDVDCAGGSGNGPAYVQGPVRIIGIDIYDLDRDGDGIACDR